MVGRVSLVRAANPSPLTLSGTNSYLVDSNGEAICVDPGPPIAAHVRAIERKAEELSVKIVAIVLTHSHPDHAPASVALARDTGAPVYAHPASRAKHDRDLTEGDLVRAGCAELIALETPGHTADHLIFYEPHLRALFTGDTVLGEGYVIVAPPHGDMRDYQRTLKRLAQDFSQTRVIYGGHGEPVFDPQEKIADYIAHRQSRERALIDALREGPKTITELLETVYAQTDRALWPAAARQILAYLRALEREGSVRSQHVSRPLNPQEQDVLNPAIARLVGPEQAELVEAELGSEMQIRDLLRYHLV